MIHRSYQLPGQLYGFVFRFLQSCSWYNRFISDILTHFLWLRKANFNTKKNNGNPELIYCE